ncbi:MAG: hypothetical protein ACPKOI_06535 [Pleomorphochaeta sp.]
MIKIYKKLLFLLLLTLCTLSSLYAQYLSFDIIEGRASDLSLYNEYGKRVSLNSNSNIKINNKIILKTQDKDVTINYTYGTLEIGANSIVVIDPFKVEPQIYLIDGQITLDTDSLFIQKYSILTPVSEYEFKSPAKINVISTADLEYGIFYSGQGTSYNALTNERTYMTSAQMIDMAYPDNFSLDIPQDYLTQNINIETNRDIINLIKSEYAYKEQVISASNKKESIANREAFLNANYLLGLKPIQKSNNFDNVTTINFIVTGNGQGNIYNFNLPALSGIVKDAKNNNQNILLIDGGNTLNGSPFVAFDKGKTAIKILDDIGYDIFVPGAIDFANGIKNLTTLNKTSNINFISTNAMNNDNLFYFNPYGLYLFDDFKIAVLGLSNPSDLTQLMDLNLTDDVLVQNAQNAINEAKQVADYVILVTNLNYNEFNSNNIISNIKGIDLIIDSNNSDASLLNINGVPVLRTGVGYSEIQNYTINVKDSKVVSTRYAKVYTSNLLEDNNSLLKSLNLTTANIDRTLNNYINQVNVPDNLSAFLLTPTIISTSTTTNDTKIKNTVNVNNANAPEAPSFSDNLLILPEETATVLDLAPAKPNFTNVKINANIPAPKFKPLAFSVRKQEVIEEPIKTEPMAAKEEPTVEYQKANIYSGENEKLKAHIGLDTSLVANIDVKDSTFLNNDYYGNVSIKPYINYGGFSFALNLAGDINSDLSFSTDLYPLPPTTPRDITEYALSVIDHLNIVNASQSIDINIDRNTFDTNLDSAIAYDKLGGTDLHLNTQLVTPFAQLNVFTSNLNLYEPINNETIENVSVNAKFTPVDLLNIKVGALAIGNFGTLDVYPSINFDFIPVNNKDLQVKFNIGATLYFNAIPTFDYTTIIDPNDPNLVPNYIANTSLAINSDALKVSIGANYLITKDENKFTTYMLHPETIRTAIFTTVGSNTLSAIAKVKYNNDIVNLSLIYTLPFDMNTLGLEEDLLNIDLSLNFDRFGLGGYYYLNDAINHIKDIMNIKSFLINNNTEYGGYISYKYKDLTLKANLALPGSTTVPLAFSVSMNYKLDFAF